MPFAFLGRPLPRFTGSAASACLSWRALGVRAPSGSALSAGASGGPADSSPPSITSTSTSSSSDMTARAQLAALLWSASASFSNCRKQEAFRYVLINATCQMACNVLPMQ